MEEIQAHSIYETFSIDFSEHWIECCDL